MHVHKKDKEGLVRTQRLYVLRSCRYNHFPRSERIVSDYSASDLEQPPRLYLKP